MMNKILIFLCTIFLTNSVFGQIVEKEMNMSSGEQSGLEVDLPIASKDAEKIWKNYVKPYGKIDWDRRNKEHVLFDVRIPSISSSTITIVARFNQYKDMTKGSFWIKSAEGYFNSTDQNDEMRATGSFLQEYAYETERHSIRASLKNEDKNLKNLDKQLSKLVKKNQSLHKAIDKAKEEIAKKEKEIADNLKAQEEKKKDIELQKVKVQETTLMLTNVGKTSE